MCVPALPGTVNGIGTLTHSSTWTTTTTTTTAEATGHLRLTTLPTICSERSTRALTIVWALFVVSLSLYSSLGLVVVVVYVDVFAVVELDSMVAKV